jgi:hypothetical protein
MIKKCPVAQHRWFEKGAGWAYDHAMDSRMPQLSVALDAELKKPVTADELIAVCRRALGGWLVGERVADPYPPDPKAVARGGAFVLRVALLDQADEPDPDKQAEVREKLRRLPPPVRGKQDLLIEIGKEDLVLEPVLEAIPAIEKELSTAAPVPWFTLALLVCGVGMIALPFLGAALPGDLKTAALVAPALGGVVVYLALSNLWRYLMGPAHDPRPLARNLEEKWGSASSGLVSDSAAVIAKEWVGLLAGGRVIAQTDRATISRFPSIDVEARETLVQGDDNKLIVQGSAAYSPSDYARPAGVWLHVYSKVGDVWQMVLAAEIVEPVPVPPAAAIDYTNGTSGASPLIENRAEKRPYPIDGYDSEAEASPRGQ